MKPTQQEKQWLKDYLYQALTYRETFDEVYDHILLALEHKERQRFFEANVAEIIDEDFGGSINMLNMEVDCKTVTDREIRTAYWQTYGSWFMTPKALYTLCIFSGILLLGLLNNLAINIIVTVVALLIGTILPLVLLLLKISGPGKKASIKDSSFRWLIIVFILVNMFIIKPVFKLFNYLLMHALRYGSIKTYGFSLPARVLGTLAFMIVVLHVLTLVKLYRDDSKSGIIKA